jgi:hypothetical protein
MDVEAQMGCAGDLVDVLATGALGADGGEFHFVFSDGVGGMHGCTLTQACGVRSAGRVS